jgi:predicted AAA+ superfamily ATPase
MIARSRYEVKIRDALRRSKITAILGPRQSGKTTLAKHATRDIESHYFDLESPRDRARLQNPEMYLSSLSGLILLDEIQSLPELFPILRVLADQSSENGRFMILGSASQDLVKGASESLAGRVEFIDLHGFDLSELGPENVRSLWVRGGFPLSFLAESDENSTAWRENFVRTFLQRDLPQFGVNISESTMRRFWTMLAHSHGQILNSSRLAGSMGLSDKTIRSYIDVLTATYMVRQLPPWYENLKKRQVKSPKLYLTDTGLLHQLLGIPEYDSLQAHPQVGSSWESFVIEQILRHMDGEQGYFWSTYSGAELDLLLLIDGRRIGIECKYSEAPKATKSMHSALHHLQLDILYIAYPGADDFPLTDKITVRSLPSLLTEYS